MFGPSESPHRSIGAAAGALGRFLVAISSLEKAPRNPSACAEEGQSGCCRGLRHAGGLAEPGDEGEIVDGEAVVGVCNIEVGPTNPEGLARGNV